MPVTITILSNSLRRKISELFKEQTDTASIQLLRYTFVGGIAYLLDIACLFTLTEYLGVQYLISAAIAFLLGLITNYCLSTVWVFHKRKVEAKSLEFSVFALIGIVGLGLNELFIWFFTEYIGFHYLESKIVSSVFVYLWNFLMRKYTLFN